MALFTAARLPVKRGIAPSIQRCFSKMHQPMCSAPAQRLTIGKLKKKLQSHAYPALRESELSEKFIKGSGPGGQKINKTSSCVQLTHFPSGLTVKCQAERSLECNRKEARRLLQYKLDHLLCGSESKLALKKLIHRERQRVYDKKRRNRTAATKEATG